MEAGCLSNSSNSSYTLCKAALGTVSASSGGFLLGNRVPRLQEPRGSFRGVRQEPPALVCEEAEGWGSYARSN